MPAELANCRIDRLVVARKARNASNVIGRVQPGTFVDQRIEIVCIETDCLNPFRRKIVVLSWICRQGNWMKTKTLSPLDVSQTTTPMAFNQDKRSSCHCVDLNCVFCAVV